MTKVWQKGIWKVHLEKWKSVSDAPCQRVRGELERSQRRWNPSQRLSSTPVALGGLERIYWPLVVWE